VTSPPEPPASHGCADRRYLYLPPRETGELDITLCTDHVECNRGNTLPLLEVNDALFKWERDIYSQIYSWSCNTEPRTQSWRCRAPALLALLVAWPQQGWQPGGAAARTSLPGTRCAPRGTPTPPVGTHSPGSLSHRCLQVPAQTAPVHPEPHSEVRTTVLIREFAFPRQSSDASSSAVL